MPAIVKEILRPAPEAAASAISDEGGLLLPRIARCRCPTALLVPALEIAEQLLQSIPCWHLHP
jgi:hypothetical protein